MNNRKGSEVKKHDKDYVNVDQELYGHGLSEEDMEGTAVAHIPGMVEVEQDEPVHVTIEEEEPPKIVKLTDEEKAAKAMARKKSTSESQMATVAPKVDTHSSMVLEKKDALVATQLRRSLMSLKETVDAQKSSDSQKHLLQEATEPASAVESKTPIAAVPSVPAVPMPRPSITTVSSERTGPRKSVVIVESHKDTDSLQYETASKRGSIIRRGSRLGRESIVSRISDGRQTIAYELEPRIRKSQLHEDILKAFSGADQDKPFNIFDEEEPEEMEEEEVIEEEQLDTLDREPYYEAYDYYHNHVTLGLMKSYVLQKKLSIYFKRRKMESVLEEELKPTEPIHKYYLKLEAYKEALDISATQRAAVSAELATLREKRRTMKENVEKLFKAMQARELEIGKGLISIKTGNEIPEKLVEKYIKRQREEMTQVSTMLLKFMRLKYMVQEKMNAITDIDEIEPGMYLTNYEQLKMENRAHVDKMEEKEDTLTRLRSKCQNTIQILAHLRDKGAETEVDLEDLRFDKMSIEARKTEARENLNNLKIQRDILRQKTNIIREESGLLTRPTLILDMEESLVEFKEAKQELESLLNIHKVRSKLIRNLRLHIESIQAGEALCRPSRASTYSKRDDSQGSVSSMRLPSVMFRRSKIRSRVSRSRPSESSGPPTRKSRRSTVEPNFFGTRSRTSIPTIDVIQLKQSIRNC